MPHPLTPADYERAALALRVSVATVRAVSSVESSGLGFRPDGHPAILFEGHHFSRYTRGVYDQSHPTLSYPRWTKQFYGKNWIAENERFQAALALNRTAALLSTSFGAFQIMGFNFSHTGCTSINEFYTKVSLSSAQQLDLFVQFILTNGLDDELRSRKWASFARQYNGPRYRENQYDTKLAAAYAAFSSSST